MEVVSERRGFWNMKNRCFEAIKSKVPGVSPDVFRLHNLRVKNVRSGDKECVLFFDDVKESKLAQTIKRESGLAVAEDMSLCRVLVAPLPRHITADALSAKLRAAFPKFDIKSNSVLMVWATLVVLLGCFCLACCFLICLPSDFSLRRTKWMANMNSFTRCPSLLRSCIAGGAGLKGMSSLIARNRSAVDGVTKKGTPTRAAKTHALIAVSAKLFTLLVNAAQQCLL